MKNHLFDIRFYEAEGTIDSLRLCGDQYGMNWCAEDGRWGFVHQTVKDNPWGDYLSRYQDMKLVSFRQDERAATSAYENGVLRVTVDRFFDEEGYLRERYAFRNMQYAELLLSEENCSIEVPFNDRYTDADDCMRHRCNTHIWCGLDTTYVNALRMGESRQNLGMVVTEGSFSCYSQTGLHSSENSRGRFLLHPAFTGLAQNEEYVIAWVIFPHAGKTDFRRIARKYSHYVDITAEHFTLFRGEKIMFSATTAFVPKKVCIHENGTDLTFTQVENRIDVAYLPQELGEKRIYLEIDGLKTYAEFVVKEDFKTLLEKRIQFIRTHQQYRKAGSSLDGAFLIYDNKTEHMVFDNYVADHNASRERIGMALLIARYLQKYKDHDLYDAILRYDTFVRREIYDEKNGYVYNTVGRDKSMIRLYNAPWVSIFFTEMYELTGDRSYLDRVLLLLQNYYGIGGKKFYPNGISMLRTAKAFRKAGMETEYREVLGMFRKHVDNMVANGTSYPKHEVNYEQTIVSPAVTFISEFAILSGEESYAKAAKPHVLNLERFAGEQPSFRLHEIPIRYWDDFWFGNLMLFGDTFPHYWSCLSARSYKDYYQASGDEAYLGKAEECIRNCMCLFSDDGRGSAAYIYPYKVNENFGQVYDNWANDQDFALYFALETGLLDRFL